MQRILGLDVGSKTIGIAVSDGLGLTAQAVVTIERKGIEKDLAALRELADAYGTVQAVVGLPKSMDGSLKDQALKVLEFAELLGKNTGWKVILWDERLSTVAAERTLLEADVSRKGRRKVINQMAAQWILQGYLDRLKNTHGKDL